jgi:ligand-binding SRPBCC domain-containing protein
MTDRVIYRMPMTALGGNIASPWVKSDILKIFNYRTKIIGEVFPTKT